MKREITIKLTQTGPNAGPFSVFDNFNNVLDEYVTRKDLIKGRTYLVDVASTVIIIKYIGVCLFVK